MSCIYGPHQQGNEDQGWVAHFLLRALQQQTITLYGDGKQVRDALYVDDLVDALLLAREQIHALSGQAFNIGGGPRNTTSLLELIDTIEVLRGERPRLAFDAWRPGDQRYYVSDTRKFEAATGWRPRMSLPDGVARLHEWLLRPGSEAAAAAARDENRVSSAARRAGSSTAPAPQRTAAVVRA
jgi:CDP-paratose 2-epimerase